MKEKKREKIIPEKYIGKKINRLTILGVIKADIKKDDCFKCQCSCGNKVDLNVYKVLFQQVKSCGCLRVEKARKTKNYKKMHTSDAITKRLLTNDKEMKPFKVNLSTGIRNIYLAGKNRPGYRIIIERRGEKFIDYARTLEEAKSKKNDLIDKINSKYNLSISKQ